MIKELILSSVLSFSVSVRTPNDATQPLDYEFMTKLEKTDGYVTYLLKRDWEREYGMKYIDNVAKLNLNVYDNSYEKLRIPLKKNARSLNISIAAAITLSEALKQNMTLKND